MPANLTPQYLKAEEAYRRDSSPEEELACLEIMLREIPKHKGTDKLQADLKQKISRLKKEVQQAKGAAKKGHGVRIPRQGAGRVAILGGPNAGKSQLLAAVTRAKPEVADYPFTTREPLPGMMPWEDVMIQLIDLPPVTADVCETYIPGLIRGADLALLMVDLGADEGIDHCQAVLNRFSEKTRLSRETRLDDEDVGVSYTRTFLVPNKIDLPDAAGRLELLHEFCPVDLEEHVISAKDGTGVEALREAIFRSLDVVRVYTKAPCAKEPDYEKPFTIRRGGTLFDIAEMIHKDLAASLKGARVWGSGAHDGVMVKADYVLQDKDVVEIKT